jgi:hypothetical protein
MMPSWPRKATKLPYSIELWDDGGQALKRVLARALDAELANAIFHPARKEHRGARAPSRTPPTSGALSSQFLGTAKFSQHGPELRSVS